jgi:hypothetical protein
MVMNRLGAGPRCTLRSQPWRSCLPVIARWKLPSEDVREDHDALAAFPGLRQGYVDVQYSDSILLSCRCSVVDRAAEAAGGHAHVGGHGGCL